MQILNPDMSPVRFFEFGSTPDFQDIFPNIDNVYHGRRWIEGLHPTSNYTDWVYNKEMKIQFRIVTEGDDELVVWKFDGTEYVEDSTLSPVDITPLGWVSEKVYRYSWTPTEPGAYYLESVSAGFRSEKIGVHQSLKFKRRLIELEYYNTENDYGMVFVDNGTPVYTGLAYFTGSLKNGTPGNDISAFTTDRGEIRKQRSTPTKNRILTLNDIHYDDADRINLILSCNRISVNGKTFMNKEAPKSKEKKNVDLVDISVGLMRTNYNYFTNG